MTHENIDLELAFTEHGAFLRRIALALTADPWEADDATQETILAAAQRGQDRPEALRPWLATVLKRTILRQRRTRARRHRRELKAARPESVDGSAREALLRDLAEMLAVLPGDDQSLLIRRYWDGLSTREIAELLGIPRGTVESRLHRAIETLRRRMDERSGGRRSAWVMLLLSSPSKPSGFGIQEAWFLMSMKKIVGISVIAFVVLLTLISFGVFDSNAEPDLSVPGKADIEEHVAEPRRGAVETALLTTEKPRTEPEDEERARTRPSSRVGRGRLRVGLKLASMEVAANTTILATAVDNEIGLVEVMKRTDANGWAQFEDLPEGRHELVCPRNSQRAVVVVAGRETVYEWVMHEAPALEGRVLDEDGRAIASARIHLSLVCDPEHFALAAETDQQGHFRLEGVASHHLVITAPGHRPSPLIVLADEERETLVIRLRRGAGRLAMRLVDEQDRPVRDAWCRVVDASIADPSDHDEAPEGEPELPHHHGFQFAHALRSDDEGRIEIDGLGSDHLLVQARAPGFQPRSFELRLTGADDDFVRVLSPEIRLLGQVVESETGPGMPGLRVSTGPYRGAYRFRGRTDREGRFEISGLVSGSLTFEIDADERGEMKTRTTITADEVQERRFIFDSGPSLRARIVDDALAPVAGLRIRSRPLHFIGRVTIRTARTDANGRFELRSVEDLPQLVEIYSSAQSEQPLLVVKGLRPGSEEHQIELGPRNRAASHIRGRVVDEEGRAVTTAEIVIFGEDTLAASSREVDEEGRFRYGPFAAGPYTLMISAEGFPEVTRIVELGRDEEVDLADIVLPRPGRAIARLSFAPGSRAGTPSASVVSDEARSFSCHVEGDRCITPALAPGRYTLVVSAAEHVEAHRVIEIVSGRDLELDLPLVPGSATRIVFTTTEGEALPETFRVRIVREDGTEMLERRHRVGGGYDFQIHQVLPPGLYRFIVENDLGLHREQSVTLSSVGAPEVRVELDISGR